jgi:ketosteroid isomerase-like protein
MSQENVEAVRRLFDAAARRDAETIREIHDPNVTWAMSPEVGPDSGVYHGFDGLVKAFGLWVGQFEDHWLELDEVISSGKHQVVSVWRDGGRGRASGVPVERSGAFVHTFLEGMVINIQQFTTKAEALKAVGVSE